MTPDPQRSPEPAVRRPRRPDARDRRVLLVFTALYAGATVLGRATLVDGGVALVWPAAGVSVLWLVARARRPWPWLDVVAIVLTTWAVVTATGAPVGAAAVGGVAAALQAVVCAWTLARWVPYVWATRGTRQVHRVTDLGWFVAGATLSSLVTAPLVALTLALAGEPSLWHPTLLWVARNTVSILALGLLGFTVGESLHARGLPRQGADRWTGGRPVDVALALLVSPLLYLLWFVELSEVPVVFPLLALTVLAGSRLPVRTVVLHAILCGVLAIWFTLGDLGPFAALPGATTQVAVAQLYVGLLVIIGMALAVARDERRGLVAELAEARDRAQEQAALLGTVVETMSEGVRVVDAQGRVVVRNPTARRLLTGTTARLDLTDSTSDLAGLSRLDGSPVPDGELPFRRALAGEEVRDLDLLVRVPGAPEPRVVTFSASAIPEGSGGGVVTVLRDVTAERTELRRAAQVQASLLPGRGLEVPGFDLAARFVPAGSVGGDFYDWQRVPDGLVITLADVMGKGPAAAILAATTRSVLHAQPGLHDVAGTLAATERAMDADLVNAGAFVTMFRAYVDVADGAVSYTDAGHGLSFVVAADGSARRLAATGLPLGISSGTARTSAQTRLGPGDLLVTFSDGVLDAIGGSLSDLDQVGRAVRGAGTAQEAADAVLALAGDPEHPEDDLTVVALLRTA